MSTELIEEFISNLIGATDLVIQVDDGNIFGQPSFWTVVGDCTISIREGGGKLIVQHYQTRSKILEYTVKTTELMEHFRSLWGVEQEKHIETLNRILKTKFKKSES